MSQPSRAIDELAELEQQRSFLLASLRDLEAERRAGDLDDHDYEALRDDYTRRAAEVLRAIDEGKAALPPRPARSWRWRILVAAGVIAVGLLAGFAVAQFSGTKLPSGASLDDIGDMSTSALLAQARQLVDTDPQTAQQLYGEVLARDPEHAEARTYSAWMLVTQAMGSGDNELRREAVSVAVDRLTQVTKDDPTYADPYCFLGVIGVVNRPDLVGENLDRCLELDPPAELRRLAEQARQTTPGAAPATATTI